MKNIHVLPTDNPSRLRINPKGKLILSNIPIGSKGETQNIYITSDEEIKEGWKGYAYKEDVKGKVFKHSYTYNQWYKDAKQIILTTDQDLIKDGVQEVSSEFLSFFAENPVDYVKVEKWLDDEGERFYSFGFPPKKEKDIIMELQKDPLLKEFDDKVIENLSALKNKKETEENIIEEAKKIWDELHPNPIEMALFGAKWQKERLYTEEEVYFILCEHTAELFKGSKLTLSDWFEKFKK